MDYLVVFISEEGFGNAKIKFEQDLPTFEEIRKAEKKIQNDKNLNKTVILNIIKLHE